MSTSFLGVNVFHQYCTRHMFIGGILSWLTFVHLYKLPKQGSCFTTREGQALLSIHVLYISLSIPVNFSLLLFILPLSASLYFGVRRIIASLSGDKT